MKKAPLLIGGAWLAQGVSWFLPIAKEGVALPDGIPGWQAFRVAACPVWPYHGVQIDEWYNVALSLTSAASTLLFIFGSVLVMLHGSRAMSRVSAWVASLAFMVNAHWLLRFGSDRFGLEAGYFVWWFSFILLALGFLVASREAPVDKQTSRPSILNKFLHAGVSTLRS